MRRLLACLLLGLAACLPAFAQVAPPTMTARSWLLLDVTSGHIIASHEADLLAMRPLPRVVWLQQGIRNDAFAERLRAHGITVVQDRCTLADHRALGLGPPG